MVKNNEISENNNRDPRVWCKMLNHNINQNKLKKENKGKRKDIQIKNKL